MCGMVAQYNEAEFPPGPNLGFVVAKRVRIEGLLVFAKPARYAEWRALATPWVLDGSLRYREDVVDGLENAPEALAGMLGGGILASCWSGWRGDGFCGDGRQWFHYL